MFRLTDEQADRLKTVAKLRGCTQTDIVRGFIDSLSAEDAPAAGCEGEIHECSSTEIHADTRDQAVISALVGQLAVKDAQLAEKDEQIAKLMDTVAESTRAVRGAQALHHEMAQTLAIESTGQRKSRWSRLVEAWRGRP